MDGAPTTTPARDGDAAVDEPVRCARCGHALTHERARIEIAGRHAHTFMNPSGVVFHIAVFGEAPGVVERGDPTRETTWFAGTAWRYAHCGSCKEQVGWSYVVVDGDGARFFGLIEDCIARGDA